MNLRVKRLALFISFSAACLGNPYSAIAADSVAVDNPQTQAARPPRDRIPPVITLNGDPAMSILQTTVFRDPGATAVDDVSGQVRVRVQGEVNIYVPGTYTLTYTARDRDGNIASASRSVTVIADTTPPVLILKGESEMSILQGSVFSDPGYTVSDNSSARVRVTIEGYVNRHTPGIYTIIYRAKDLAGNIAETKRTVTVIADTTPPQVTLNGDNPLYVVLGTSYQDPGVSATDDSGKPVKISKINPVNVNREGNYMITYFVRDHVNNFTRITRTVIVVKQLPTDTVAPAITLNGAATIEVNVGGAYTELGATATDNVDGTVTVTTTGSVDTTTASTYTITYTATDAAGNTATATRTVTVKPLPNVTPTADAGADQTVNEQTAVTLSGTATDSDGTIISYAWVQTAGPAVNLSNANQAQVSFTAPEVNESTSLTFKLIVTDDQGAIAEDVVTVLVNAVDSTKPVITLNGAASVELTVGDTYTDAGATATDNVDGTVNVTTTGSVDTTTAGTYTLTYTAQDAAGNQADPVTRTVVIKPKANVAPSANAGSDQTINEQTTVTLTGSGIDTDGNIASYAWTQTAGAAVTLTSADQAQASFTAPDVTADTELTFKLTVTDDKGATAEDTVIVTVKAVDSTKPVITLNGAASVELTVGDTYTDAGATATDDVDGTITVTTTGSVDTTKAGTYTLTYTAKDAAGNQANPVIRTVVIKPKANVAPTANAGSDQTVNEQTTVNLMGSGTDTDGNIASYAWTQIAGTTVTLTSADQAQASFTAPDATTDTELTFKLTVTDNKGATAEDTVIVTVKPVVTADTIPPVITLNGLDKIYHYLNPDYPDDNPYIDQGATANDNVDGEVAVTKSGDNPSGLGTYILTYTASDTAGNQATQTRTIKVVTSTPIYASAGLAQTTMELETITLDGHYSSADSENGYELVAYEWKQTKGTPVSLSNPNSAITSFTAPDISTTETLEFMLTVTDNYGFKASASTTVKVLPLLSPTPQATGLLNDTGVTTCGDDTNSQLLCPISTHPNQDAQNGRDFTANDSLDGYAGFSFTKLDSQGAPLADQNADYATTPWSCVKDNVTGLIWEVKTNDGGLHDVSWNYTASDSGPNSICNLGEVECTMLNYTQAVNNQGFCGANDWRQPTLDELFGLVVLDKSAQLPNNPDGSAIDTNYFPYIKSSSNFEGYWTSDIPYIQDQRYYKAFITFKYGNASFNYASQLNGALLVRGKK